MPNITIMHGNALIEFLRSYYSIHHQLQPTCKISGFTTTRIMRDTSKLTIKLRNVINDAQQRHGISCQRTWTL